MQSQQRPPLESSYASQAARWKQGFKPASQQQPQQTDLENALVSELCSSAGSSSFPPREVLQKLLRYLHTLDHDYICELLDDKFENPLWQVQAKALSVLNALLGSGEADFYKQYYSGRLDLFEDLCHSRKDMLRARADKVYVALKDYVPPDEQDGVNLVDEDAALPDRREPSPSESSTVLAGFMHTSPVISSAQTPEDVLASMDSPRSSSAPPPGPHESGVSAFSFLAQAAPPQAPEAARHAADPLTPPVSGSAFGFLSNDDAINSEATAAAVPAPPASSDPSAFAFLAGSPPRDAPSKRVANPAPEMPTPSAPPLSTGSSGFGFLNRTPPGSSVHAIEHGLPAGSTTEMPSAFAFLSAEKKQRSEPRMPVTAVPTAATGPAASMPMPQHTHDVFDALPTPLLAPPARPSQEEEEEEKQSEPSDPIHDAFEGLDADDGAQALDSFDAYRPVTMTGPSGYGATLEGGGAPEHQPMQKSEPLREVVLEIEVPAGPMGVMLDRTIPDMTVIERFVPLPTGGRGYLELHPAICPGCALLSINSIYVENKGLSEVGPILGSLANAPKLLRFKKLMNNGRTANPSTLMMPYVPPPLEDESTKHSDQEVADGEEESRHLYEHLQDDEDPGARSSNDDGFMAQLSRYSSGLSAIEEKLNAIIQRENAGQAVPDRRNQLAQLHGTVEKIQTQGIDAVILGPNPPPNYDQVKQFRSTLVRKADELSRRIQHTVQGDVEALGYGAPAAEEKHPASAFAFVGGDSNSTVNDPPLALSQLGEDSGFGFLNANANPVVQHQNVHAAVARPPQMDANESYGFSFLRNAINQATADPLTVSQAPTSPSSSFGVLDNSSDCVGQTIATSSAMEAPTDVFAGLSLKDRGAQQQQQQQQQPGLPPRPPAPSLADTLSESSHGRPMGLSDLSLSMRSASGASVNMATMPPVNMARASTAQTPSMPAAAAGDSSSRSSFGFMSTITPPEYPVFDNSSTSTEPSSPTAFGFLRGGASTGNASSTTTAASSTASPPRGHSELRTQSDLQQQPERSMFSFISG